MTTYTQLGAPDKYLPGPQPRLNALADGELQPDIDQQYCYMNKPVKMLCQPCVEELLQWTKGIKHAG